jgi:stearoyl-CoA desaturase (delta-9 desaturase)
MLTFGEGWHNNHHAHPVSARHGLRWYEIDMNWYGIWALKKLGLAEQIYCAKLEELRQKEEELKAKIAAGTAIQEPELASV